MTLPLPAKLLNSVRETGRRVALMSLLKRPTIDVSGRAHERSLRLCPFCFKTIIQVKEPSEDIRIYLALKMKPKLLGSAEQATMKPHAG